jgi:hypothetical protein
MNLNTPSNLRNTPFLLFAMTMVAVLVALSFRSTQAVGVDLFHPGLWGEDGNIFINEAHDAGLGSLFKPYAGYMHLAPRGISYVASFLPLEYVPLAFHLAWLLAFIVTVYIIQSRLAALSVHPAFYIWALVLLAIQPQAGEVFFTLTNIQWFTGLALLAYLIFPFARLPKSWETVLIFIAGLTGPFSVLALPVLALRAVVFRDIRRNYQVYVAVALCAGIQIAFILLSSRPIAAHSTDIDPDTLISATVRFLSFGGVYPLATLFAFVFWASLPWRRLLRAAIFRFKNGAAASEQNTAELCALMLVVTAFGMMQVGFLRDDPGSIGPVILPNGGAGGSRYYLIPYSLLILAAVVSTIRDYPRAIVALTAFFIICVANFVRPEHVDHQWHAYTKLARVVPGLTIPIAPRIEADPGWSVDASGAYAGGAEQVRNAVIELSSAEVTNGEIVEVDGKTIVRSKSDSLLLTLPATTCSHSRSIGLEIEGHRDYAGWVQVLWAVKDGFSDKDSVLRFYPAGSFAGLFAFDRGVDQNSIRIRPGFSHGNIEVSQVRMYCL